MDAPDKPFSELVGLLKSWIPRRSEPANVSRDFWMPDQSCRVCYDCDSQFTVFNRRHHCRRCGRVFCAKCTPNSIPAPSSEPRNPREDWEKIRVCNYCFRQWVQLTPSTFENGIEGPILDLSSSSSVASLASTKSSGTVNSSSITLTSIPYSGDPYQQTSYSSGISLCQSSMMETNKDEQVAVESSHTAADVGDPSQNQFGFCINRSDDDEDGYAVYQSDSGTRHYIQDNYYVHAGFDDNDNDYESHKVHPDGETTEAKSLISSPLHHSFDSLNLEGTQDLVAKNEHDIADECEASSSFYAREDINAAPVDFENNGVLWLPPEPEDEEDEKEAVLFDDDDDEGNAGGEWGYLSTSSSFGSGEYRSRDKSSEEHKKVIKNVVDGHFRALVAQLLQVENLPVGEEDDNDSWLEIITSLSWEAATLLKPDMSKGGGMDPGGYVKVKCIASGHRRESMVIKGVVCKKNVAHRRMTTKVEKPRLLILGGALEYQRVSNLLSSFDTLLQQEMDHLKMAVAKIDVHRPDVLLVEKSVSRFAQEYLLAKDISLVLNIKRPLLERIARCTGAQIVPSIDHLSSQKLGYCDIFHVERLLEEHGTAGQGGKKMVKTLMFFEGCPKPLGCTILLRGANGDELKKAKHVVQYGIFAAYHLALETCFLADEGASLPDFPLNTPITVALPDKPSIDRSISTIPGFSVPVNGKSEGHQPGVEPQRSNSTPTHLASPISIAVEAARTAHLPDVPSSPNENSNLTFVNFTTSSPPTPSGKISLDSHKNMSPSPLSKHSQPVIIDDLKINGFGPPEAVGQVMGNTAEDSIHGVVTSSLDATDGSAIQQSSTNHEEDPVSSKEEFLPSPSDHQSILVSLSSRCVWKGTVCERSHLFRIKYYGNFDKPLGRYLRDNLFDQSYRCCSCEMPAQAHIHCYNHRQGTLTIAVKELPNLLPGEKEGKIWMWHRCLRCPQIKGFPPATRRIVMSDAAWGLSFGKFLELSFSNHAAASRVASCGHSLHRDCLRFYGFGKMVACFRYASIDVHSVYLPPPKLDFNYENQEWIQKEASEVVQQAELLFSEVLNSIRQIVEKKKTLGASKSGIKVSDTGHQFAMLEGMLQSEKAEFEETLQRFLGRDLKKGKPVIDILDINRLQRQLVVHSYVWNCRLVFTADANDKSIHDALGTSVSEHVEKHLDTKQSPADNSMLSFPDKGFSSCDSFVDTKLDEESIQGTVKGRYAKGSEEQSNPSVSASSPGQVDSLEPGLTIRRAHSEGKFPVMTDLSDTLDAAWTGENQPVVGMPKDTPCAFIDISTADLSATVPASVRLNLENHVDDQSGSTVSHSVSPLFSTKDTDNVDDSKSWLRMPFQSFYRKNFLGSAHKLDAFGDFNSFYVSSFRNLGLQGGARLLLPVGVNDTVIPVYDDEPASIISYALVSPEYHVQLSTELERPKDSGESVLSLPILDPVRGHTLVSLDESASESHKSLGSTDESIPPSYAKAMHAKVSFTDDSQHGKVKYTVICYYANQFEALRRICCPHELDFVRSLSRCKKWGAQGGKSNVFFAKTLDDRFILKQVTKTELESFIKFAPGYFKYLSHSSSTGSPTCLAKILGIYQVTSKHHIRGKESKMDILVMENLLFGRNITRLYDLKGSSRSRYNPDSSGSNKVLLDENLIEAMPTSPIFVGNKAKRLLERAVWNDTSFLATIDVMDYSLLVGMDEEKHELVLGIIDFMRQYTWDKHLETWVKASGILGGPKNASPTVISPMQYKKRFRKAMTTYFLMVPDQWPPPTIIPSRSQSDLREENAQDRATAE